VVVTVSGTFDRGASQQLLPGERYGQVRGSAFLDVDLPYLALADATNFGNADRYQFDQTFTIGDGTATNSTAFNTASGTHIGFDNIPGTGTNGLFFFINRNYVSNSAISTTATMNNTTLAALHLKNQVLNLSVGSGNGFAGNKITISIGQPVIIPVDPGTPVTPTPTVPEPATWAMMLVGFGAMGAVLRRRSAKIRFA